MSYHKITVIGYAGSEPEHQVTATGKDVAQFPLYVNERYKDKERTVRYKVKVWNDLSLIVSEHLLKGQLLMVEGKPSVDVWRSAEGKPRARLVVTARELRFLGAKPSSAESNTSQQDE